MPRPYPPEFRNRMVEQRACFGRSGQPRSTQPHQPVRPDALEPNIRIFDFREFQPLEFIEGFTIWGSTGERTMASSLL
jgi:hypothetical protein